MRIVAVTRRGGNLPPGERLRVVSGSFDTAKDDGSVKAKSKYKRSDSDFVLNYKLNDYFKIFEGMKYLTDKATFRIRSADIHTGYGEG